MTPEGKLKKDVKGFLDGLPALWYYQPVQMGYGRNGIPDFIGCFRGKFFSIETKSIIGELSPWQKRETEEILLAGGLAIAGLKDLGFDQFKKLFLEWAGLYQKH